MLQDSYDKESEAAIVKEHLEKVRQTKKKQQAENSSNAKSQGKNKKGRFQKSGKIPKKSMQEKNDEQSSAQENVATESRVACDEDLDGNPKRKSQAQKDTEKEENLNARGNDTKGATYSKQVGEEGIVESQTQPKNPNIPTFRVTCCR